jgi:hypothetical protein
VDRKLTSVKGVLELVVKVLGAAETGRSVKLEIVAVCAWSQSVKDRMRTTFVIMQNSLVERVRNDEERLVFLAAGVLQAEKNSQNKEQ